MSIVKRFFNFLTEAGDISRDKKVTEIEVAFQKVKKLYNANDTLSDICLSIECAENRDELKAAFDHLNRIVRILLVAAPAIEHNWKVVEVLRELKCSDKLLFHLKSATVRQAVIQYKTEVTKELVGKIRQTEVLARLDDSFDEKLLSSFFHDTPSNISNKDLYAKKQDGEQHITVTSSPYRKKITSPLSKREPSKDTEDFPRKRLGSAQMTSEEHRVRKSRRRFSNDSPKGRQINMDSAGTLAICDAFRSGTCRRGRKCKYKHT